MIIGGKGISNIEQGMSNGEVRFFTSLCSVQNDRKMVCGAHPTCPDFVENQAGIQLWTVAEISSR